LVNFFRAKKDALPPEALDSSALGQLDISPKEGWLTRLKRGLTRSSNQLRTGLDKLLLRKAIDEMLFDDLETLLITSDVGVRATSRILGDLRRAVQERRIAEVSNLEAELKRILINVLLPLEHPLETTKSKPFVIMIAGVNGSGKTTTIGKLAKYFHSQGKSVMLAAGDTFRAAAREQLMAWGARNNVPVVAQEDGDSAAVIFDAIHSAKARSIDIVLADTAGRLPTQLHLMEEIKKVKRVIGKVEPGAPHETLLVLDANTGQNGLVQVSAFDQALQLSGLVITKLDGTAKGGVIAALACERAERPIPVRFIGVGEGIEDLRPFVAREFVEALFQ
jgi:fused signal recognition particle receptor